MPAPRKIAELVERFERNLEDYRSGRYKETQLRLEFIDPFFEALGWDVHNKRGYAEAYKDVIHEDAIKVGGATKAPDYCFRIGGTRKFFVEAKKPSVSIRDAVHPAYQLRRYAWSAKLPLSILTDFEEFAAYDCRIKPARTDKASAARTLYVPFTEYPSRWDDIASIFSREEVLKGSFDKYAESTKRKKGTAEVDSVFLQEIEVWRDSLARNIALRNPQLTQRELNFAVQRTIDRIIFLRICEDRGVEHYGQLQALLNGTNVYPRVCQLFYRADERYNSGLFHFQKEKGRPAEPDELTPGLTIDDKVLKDIITRLYYPESPYEFSVLPADILGQVYEQFLGKVIRLTAGHRAVVEDKPEVRKAGGVYYTPTYIVDYIVRNTVGKLLAGEGSGYGDSGSGKGDGSYGAEDVSRPSGLAKGDGPGRSGLHDDGSLSGPGEVRADQPDSEGGGLDSRQHRGGLRQDTPRGLSSSSLDCEGLANGGGDVSDVGGASEIRQQGACSGSLGPDRTGGQNADEAHCVSQAPPDPIPPTLNPTPQPLTPKEASRLRILDPACGSGSFLIGAYQYLLGWHLNWYTTHNPEKWARKKNPPIYETRLPQPPTTKPHTPNPIPPTPSYRLTTSERKRILLNNIYGVDIDPQAVEVTKLSLLLKVLEGENEETLERQLKFFHERALPDLGSNIKCGNSLIGPDFYDNQQMTFLDEEERYRINAFDWNAEFPQIMKSGGFDAVIGNPPYVRPHKLHAEDKQYFWRHYPTFVRKSDLYCCFIQLGVSLLRRGGRFGYIVSDGWLRLDSFRKLRTFLLDETSVQEIIDFEGNVFADATVKAAVLLVSKGATRNQMVSVAATQPTPDLRALGRRRIPQDRFRRTYDCIFDLSLDEAWEPIKEKMRRAGVPLGELFEISFGLKTGDDSRFLTASPDSREHKPLLRGENVHRYSFTFAGEYVWYVPQAMTAHRVTARPGTRERFEQPKVLVRDTGAGLQGTFERLSYYVKDVLIVSHKSKDPEALMFLAGVLNSRLMRFYYETSFPTLHVQRNELASLPIRAVTLSDREDGARRNRMVHLVERMLDLHNSLAAAKTAHEKTVLGREIETTDRQIDKMVYELYGLTEEEIRIVEEGTNGM